MENDELMDGGRPNPNRESSELGYGLRVAANIKIPAGVRDFLYYPPLKLWRKPDKAHQRCKVTSNHRMLICVACRNGDVPAKICVKSLEKFSIIRINTMLSSVLNYRKTLILPRNYHN